MRIHALELEAADPGGLGAFYEGLGLPVVPSKTGVVVSFGRTDVAFVEADSGVEPFYHFAVTIPENRFEAAYEWLDDQVGVLADDSGATRFEFDALLDATACYFRDPAGNIGELIARHSLDNGLPDGEPFCPQHLLGVSEIGLVVDDVPSVAGTLEAVTGEPDLGGGDDFRMLGDDHGTFIVVDRDRPWFVSGDEPGVYPTTMVADVDAGYEFQSYPYEIRVA